LAVVPFDKIGVSFGVGSEAGQLAGPCRTLQRTGEHFDEFHPSQPFSKPHGIALAIGRQGQIG
jgi:hypothetical protein